MATSETIARIAIISFETPEILAELQRMNVHGVLSKPIRIFGLLAALTTAIGVDDPTRIASTASLAEIIYKI